MSLSHGHRDRDGGITDDRGRGSRGRSVTSPGHCDGDASAASAAAGPAPAVPLPGAAERPPATAHARPGIAGTDNFAGDLDCPFAAAGEAERLCAGTISGACGPQS